jgi:hypothetical protein
MIARAFLAVHEEAGSGWHPRAGDGRDRWPRRALLFPLGQIVATPGALAAFTEAEESPLRYLARHGTGDWGELDAEDWTANDRALRTAERLLSAYILRSGERLWIVTEADRSVTTLLLPSEY